MWTDLYDELKQGLPPGQAPAGCRSPCVEGGPGLGLEAGARGGGAEARPVLMLQVSPELPEPGGGASALGVRGRVMMHNPGLYSISLTQNCTLQNLYLPKSRHID